MNCHLSAIVIALSCFTIVSGQLWRYRVQEAIRLEQRDRAIAQENQALNRDIAVREERIDTLKSDVIQDRNQLNRMYDRDGYDQRGYGRDGYTRLGYNEYGVGRDGYDRDGYNRDGYHRYGYHRDDYGRHLYDDYGGGYGGSSGSGGYGRRY